jgi:cytoplasmic FMR1 interacting protein
MLNEINESVSPSTSGGRIGLHMLRSLVNDLFPNFNYNNYTERFVPSPIPIRPATYGKSPKQSAINQAYGSVGCKAHEMCGKLSRGFFGRIQIESYLSLGLSLTEISTVIDQCLRNLYDKLSDVSEYMEALKSGIPPCKPPSFQFMAIGGYGFYEGKLKTLLTYDGI